MLARPVWSVVLLSLVMLSIAFASPIQAADNVFLPPGGGDLLDPANWSNGVVPTQSSDVGIINESGHQDFTVKSNDSSLQIGWFGPGVDAAFDLQGHTTRAILASVIEQPHPESWKFTNGQFLYESVLASFQSNSTHYNLELRNTTWEGRIRATNENGSVVIDNGSSISNLWLTGKTQHVDIKGHSSAAALPTYYETIRLDGTESVSLVVDEGSSLGPGLYRLNTRLKTTDPEYPAELTIRGGSTTTNIDVQISPISTILVEGNGTHADFKTLAVAAGNASNFTDYLRNPTSSTIVRDKAVVSVHGPPPEISGPHFGPQYSFSLGKLILEGEETRFELSGPNGGYVVELSVVDGAILTAEQPIEVTSKALIDHSTVFSSLKNSGYFGFLPGVVPFSISIVGSEIHGDVTDFKLLDLNQSLIEGNATAAKIIGNGLIDGDVTPSDSIRNIEIHPDGHLEITGNLTFSGLYFDIFSRDHFDSLEVGTSLLGRENLNLLDLLFQAAEIATHIQFADEFFASVGDRFVLLHYTGGNIEYDALHRLNPNVLLDETFQRQLLNITIDNLPDGYQIDVFLENNDIGFRVVAVPEVSTIMLVGIGLGSLLVVHRNRRQTVVN